MAEFGFSDVIFTIISQSSAARARCLIESLEMHQPHSKCIICLVEEVIDQFIFPPGSVNVILAKDIVGGEFYKLAYQYSSYELNAILKPQIMRHFCNMPGVNTCTYMDPECYLFSPLVENFRLLSDGANIILVPHAIEPKNESALPRDIDILETGTFNLGFISVRASSETMRFLNWWSLKVRERDLYDSPGTHKWVDLAPCYFDGVVVLRHAGYNVTCSNMLQRNLREGRDGWAAEDEPLRFFFFSGTQRAHSLAVASQPQDLKHGSTTPFCSEFGAYAEKLSRYQTNDDLAYTYTYSLVWEGHKIESEALRKVLRYENPGAVILEYTDFSQERLIREVLRPEPSLPPDEMFPISRLLYHAWRSNPCLGFELFTGQSRAQFFVWIIKGGYQMLGVHPSLLPWTELTTPAPRSGGSRLRLTPVLWLLWLTDDHLRRGTAPTTEKGASRLILKMTEEIAAGRLPRKFLSKEYLDMPIIGELDDEIRTIGFAIWTVRDDLAHRFPLTTRAGRLGLLTWLRSPRLYADFPWLASFRLMPVPVSTMPTA